MAGAVSGNMACNKFWIQPFKVLSPLEVNLAVSIIFQSQELLESIPALDINACYFTLGWGIKSGRII